MPRLPIRPQSPNPQLLEMAADVVALAGHLSGTADRVVDRPLRLLGSDLYAWAVPLERLATSSPAHQAAVFAGLAESDDGGDLVTNDPLIYFRAVADTLAFVGIGDLVLGRASRAWLRQLGIACGDDDEPFPLLLRAADDVGLTGRPAQVQLRRLQVSLRSSRNRLLAHPKPLHVRAGRWDEDGTPVIAAFSRVDPPTRRDALIRLRLQIQLPGSLPLPDDPIRAIEAIADLAPDLTYEELQQFDRATRVIGYLSFPISHVVWDLLNLCRAIQPVAGDAAPAHTPETRGQADTDGG